MRLQNFEDGECVDQQSMTSSVMTEMMGCQSEDTMSMNSFQKSKY